MSRKNTKITSIKSDKAYLSRFAASAPFPRHLRVAEEIHRVLADLFTRTEFRDPLLTNVTITVIEVRLTPDFRHATVFVSCLGQQHDIKTLLPAIERVAPWLRAQLARVLRLRAVPELHFKADTTFDAADHINALLHLPEVQRDLIAHEQHEQGSDNDF